MPIVKNKPIEAEDDKSIKNVLGQKEAAIICFYDSNTTTNIKLCRIKNAAITINEDHTEKRLLPEIYGTRNSPHQH